MTKAWKNKVGVNSTTRKEINMKTNILNLTSILAAITAEIEKQMQSVVVTENNAQQVCDELNSLTESVTGAVDKIMIPIAIEHECYVDRGEYGSGRSLVVTKDHWSGYEPGEWVSSSETC